MAQQVRRAAALTAELAAQSEKKTAAVCDQPPGLDELAGHIEAPNMGAGGSHPPGHNDARSLGHVQISICKPSHGHQSSSSEPEFLQLLWKVSKRAIAIEHASPRQR